MNHTYAFVGLTPSERSLLESLFSFDAQDEDGDVLVPVGLGDDGRAPDLLIVNGDDLAVAQRLSAGYPRAVLVLVGEPRGGQRVPWPVLRRPLELASTVAVLSELDWPDAAQPRAAPLAPKAERAAPAPQSAPASVPPRTSSAFVSDGMTSAFAPTTASAPLSSGGLARPTTPHPAEPLSARIAWSTSETDAVDTGPRAGPKGAAPPDGLAESHRSWHDVLVVHGRPDGRSPSLARGLRRMGYAVKVADTAEQALQEMDRHLAPFVFLDQQSLGAQLLPLARALNALRTAPTQPPYLAVVARGGSAFDRLRARMAGCAWMRTPIERGRLKDYLQRRGLPPPMGR